MKMKLCAGGQTGGFWLQAEPEELHTRCRTSPLGGCPIALIFPLWLGKASKGTIGDDGRAAEWNPTTAHLAKHTEPQSHRAAVVWVGRALQDHPVQPPAKGHIPVEQIV